MISCLVGKTACFSGDFTDSPQDTRRGEILLGFYVRAGVWIDGLEILTSLGRRSGVYGNIGGGSGYDDIFRPAFA